MQLKPVFFQVLYEPFLVVQILSTFNMFFRVPIRTEKCNKMFSCNLFGVILHIDSTIVSFIGCVGSLMPERGLVDIMSCAFRGVDHMLT